MWNRIKSQRVKGLWRLTLLVGSGTGMFCSDPKRGKRRVVAKVY